MGEDDLGSFGGGIPVLDLGPDFLMRIYTYRAYTKLVSALPRILSTTFSMARELQKQSFAQSQCAQGHMHHTPGKIPASPSDQSQPVPGMPSTHPIC